MLVLGGLVTVALIYPLAPLSQQLALRQRWARKLLAALAIKLDAEGTRIPPGTMVVANHVSWVDIFALSALQPAAFISKAEVRQWPLFGWLACRNDTIFLKRGSRGHARQINEIIAHYLDEGRVVAVFPEGTTTDGTRVLHFHGALLQPALLAGKPIVPVAISYWEPEGERSLATAYVGDMSLGESLNQILSKQALTVRLRIMPALQSPTADRREVSAAARVAVSSGADLPPPNN